MERPQVRQVETQHVESEREVTGWEAEELLRKYGYTEEYSTRIEQPKQEPVNNLTFEEMIAKEQAKRKMEEELKRQKMYAPKPITFDGRNGYDTKTTYGSDEDSGLSFKIEISTDMKLPKY
jgi:hypothetical protein